MQISGKVASVRKDGRGFKVGDDWYSLGTRTVPAYAPEWKSNVIVDYLEQADEKGRPEKFVVSWQGESAAPRVTKDVAATHAPTSTDWDDRQESIRRQAVMNTTVAIWVLSERIAETDAATSGFTLGQVSAIALELRQAMMRDFLALEAFARTGETGQKVSMVEAAVGMGATIEPTLSNDMAAWANEPRTPDQREELITLLSERGLKESWVVEQGFTTPGVQLTRMAAANAILKLKQMVVI